MPIISSASEGKQQASFLCRVMCGFLLEGDEGWVPANKEQTLPFPKSYTSHMKEITLCHVYDNLSVGVVTLQHKPSQLKHQ